MKVPQKKAEDNSLLDAMQEVLEDIQGKTSLKQRQIKIEDIDVVSIRQKYHLSQTEFAQKFGFSLRTLQQWEQGRRRPQGSARILLKVIDYDPKTVTQAIAH